MAKRAKKRSINAKRVIKKNVRPTGIKVLSILFYVSSVITLLVGIGLLGLVLFGGEWVIDQIRFDQIMQKMPGITSDQIAQLPSLFISALILLGIGGLIKAIIDFFIARGLWKGQNWSRILVSLIMALAFIGSLIDLLGGKITNIIWIIVTGVVIWYLLFTEEVKKFFLK
jgi:hypothetical protein